MIKEKQIVHENGIFWVFEDAVQYTVYKNGITHSISDGSYEKNEDGKTIAIARCNYLSKRYEKTLLPVDQRNLFSLFDIGYYVTMIDGPKTAWLLGPFDNHAQALALVEIARNAAIEINGFYHFCAFGTTRLTAAHLPPGKLNSKLMIDI